MQVYIYYPLIILHDLCAACQSKLSKSGSDTRVKHSFNPGTSQ